MKYFFSHSDKGLPSKLAGESVFAVNEQLVGGRFFGANNPDDLVAQRGIGLKLYQDMIRDPVAIAGLEIRIFSAIKNFEIQPPSDSPEDMDIAESIRDNFSHGMDRALRSIIRDIAQAGSINGWSLMEPLWKIAEGGKFHGNIYLKNIKIKNPDSFKLVLDDFNNIREIMYSKSGFSMGMAEEAVDMSRVLVYSHDMQYDNPYGRSIFRRVFRAFFFKDKILRFWAQYAEKFAAPFKIGSFTDDARGENVKDELLAVLKKWKFDDGAILPPGTKVEFLESLTRSDTNTVFKSLIDLCNREMIIGLTGGELTVFKGSGRAESEVHERTSSQFIDFVRDEMSNFINDKLIPMMVDLNYTVPRYPKIQFLDDRIKPNREKIGRGIQQGMTVGMEIPKIWAHNTLEIPVPDKNEELLVTPVAIGTQSSQLPSAQLATFDGPAEIDTDLEEEAFKAMQAEGW